MSHTPLLPGIKQEILQTARLTTAYLKTGTGSRPLVLIHGNCSSSAFFQPLMLRLAASGDFTVYAPDLRGYGDSETAPLDATRGVRDYSDDLAAWTDALPLASFDLFGWSLGGNVVIQFVLDYPGRARSLLLQSSGSPFGFGGSKGAAGELVWEDYSGSGAGTVNADFVRRIGEGDRGAEQNSPRTVMNTFYFKPPFKVSDELEELYVSVLLSTKITPGNYPGDSVPSANWPNVSPGVSGVNNALSPKYLNQSALANLAQKPPILWFHGDSDQIVSDTSFFDIGYLGQLGFIPGWPGDKTYPPQPMISQIRAVLEEYKTNGGLYREETLAECGHAPHIEKEEQVVELITGWVTQF